ncbi:hypothetical protein D1013_16240 [Euzebyella marina]|uniref:Lipoprotein n=1 Tax=Euzebyella marina TaxID=1761453 RepID=A0A3G2L976_9FLAO|nr:hypothetical protein [Euzebyella marina]AYN68818.1 hypothetical protein D1013_16240 [Euzebyella marina]
MKKLFVIPFLILIVACKSNYKTIDFEVFEITVPEKWNRYERKGIDSYIGGIITDKKDTLKFDLGKYSLDLIENDYPMVYDSLGLSELTKKELKLLPKTNHLIVDSLHGGIDFQKYLQYEYVLDSIDCFKAKVITPRNEGFGASGIYIDSLTGTRENSNKIGISFYGWYLKDRTQAEFIEALKTLRFKKYCSQQNL